MQAHIIAVLEEVRNNETLFEKVCRKASGGRVEGKRMRVMRKMGLEEVLKGGKVGNRMEGMKEKRMEGDDIARAKWKQGKGNVGVVVGGRTVDGR